MPAMIHTSTIGRHKWRRGCFRAEDQEYVMT